MSVLRFLVELELKDLSKYELGITEFNDILQFTNDGRVASIFLSQSLNLLMNIHDEKKIAEISILTNLYLCKTPMIQIKIGKNDNYQRDEIVCPFFIADPLNFTYTQVPGTNRIKLMNRNTEILELDPENFYIFTLKQRSMFFLNSYK